MAVSKIKDNNSLSSQILNEVYKDKLEKNEILSDAIYSKLQQTHNEITTLKGELESLMVNLLQQRSKLYNDMVDVLAISSIVDSIVMRYNVSRNYRNIINLLDTSVNDGLNEKLNSLLRMSSLSQYNNREISISEIEKIKDDAKYIGNIFDSLKAFTYYSKAIYDENGINLKKYDNLLYNFEAKTLKGYIQLNEGNLINNLKYGDSVNIQFSSKDTIYLEDGTTDFPYVLENSSFISKYIEIGNNITTNNFIMNGNISPYGINEKITLQNITGNGYQINLQNAKEIVLAGNLRNIVIKINASKNPKVSIALGANNMSDVYIIYDGKTQDVLDFTINADAEITNTVVSVYRTLSSDIAGVRFHTEITNAGYNSHIISNENDEIKLTISSGNYAALDGEYEIPSKTIRKIISSFDLKTVVKNQILYNNVFIVNQSINEGMQVYLKDENNNELTIFKDYDKYKIKIEKMQFLYDGKTIKIENQGIADISVGDKTDGLIEELDLLKDLANIAKIQFKNKIDDIPGLIDELTLLIERISTTKQYIHDKNYQNMNSIMTSIESIENFTTLRIAENKFTEETETTLLKAFISELKNHIYGITSDTVDETNYFYTESEKSILKISQEIKNLISGLSISINNIENIINKYSVVHSSEINKDDSLDIIVNGIDYYISNDNTLSLRTFSSWEKKIMTHIKSGHYDLVPLYILIEIGLNKLKNSVLFLECYICVKTLIYNIIEKIFNNNLIILENNTNNVFDKLELLKSENIIIDINSGKEKVQNLPIEFNKLNYIDINVSEYLNQEDYRKQVEYFYTTMFISYIFRNNSKEGILARLNNLNGIIKNNVKTFKIVLLEKYFREICQMLLDVNKGDGMLLNGEIEMKVFNDILTNITFNEEIINNIESVLQLKSISTDETHASVLDLIMNNCHSLISYLLNIEAPIIIIKPELRKSFISATKSAYEYELIRREG